VIQIVVQYHQRSWWIVQIQPTHTYLLASLQFISRARSREAGA
jgi:hypothetical protein